MMPVAVESTKSLTKLDFSGELTIYTASETMDVVKTALKSALPIQLDLSEVSEIDAAGLQILMAIKLHSTLHGVAFNLTGCSEVVTEFLGLADLAGFFGEPIVLSGIPA